MTPPKHNEYLLDQFMIDWAVIKTKEAHDHHNRGWIYATLSSLALSRKNADEISQEQNNMQKVKELAAKIREQIPDVYLFQWHALMEQIL